MKSLRLLAVSCAVCFATLLAASANWSGFDQYKKVTENYALVSNTGSSDLHLSYILPSGDAVGRIPGKVVAVGSDSKYIVAKREPAGGGPVEFFYLDRKKDGPYADLAGVVFGPFTSEEFSALTAKLALPSFDQ